MQLVKRTSDRESDARHGHHFVYLPMPRHFIRKFEMAGQSDLFGLQLKCLAFNLVGVVTLFNHLRSLLRQPPASEYLPEGKSASGSRIGNTSFPTKIRLSRILLLR